MSSKYVNLDDELSANVNLNCGSSETETVPKSELNLQVFQPAPAEKIVRSVVTNMHFGSQSQLTVCPFCDNKVMTSTESKPTHRTHMLALQTCLMCLCCCAYFLRCAFKTKHNCPNCGAFLGYYHE